MAKGSSQLPMFSFPTDRHQWEGRQGEGCRRTGSSKSSCPARRHKTPLPAPASQQLPSSRCVDVDHSPAAGYYGVCSHHTATVVAPTMHKTGLKIQVHCIILWFWATIHDRRSNSQQKHHPVTETSCVPANTCSTAAMGWDRPTHPTTLHDCCYLLGGTASTGNAWPGSHCLHRGRGAKLHQREQDITKKASKQTQTNRL